ncbi:unnamed protein product [Rodentolepis nana]|uniref:LIM zinc-binding domain-containing protein n=1 Tax=Rodentolepis nana TaxID=102285 RepID=A0A0R3TPF4_RODNA|nr:unnamed protein product [Rodentolepis nana]
MRPVCRECARYLGGHGGLVVANFGIGDGGYRCHVKFHKFLSENVLCEDKFRRTTCGLPPCPQLMSYFFFLCIAVVIPQWKTRGVAALFASDANSLTINHLVGVNMPQPTSFHNH